MSGICHQAGCLPELPGTEREDLRLRARSGEGEAEQARAEAGATFEQLAEALRDAPSRNGAAASGKPGLAFLVAPSGKPVGVITQPDFTWLATGRLFPQLPLPALAGGREWTGLPILFVIFIVVAIIYHVIMKYTDFGRTVYAIGGNAVAARLAGIDYIEFVDMLVDNGAMLNWQSDWNFLMAVGVYDSGTPSTNGKNVRSKNR